MGKGNYLKYRTKKYFESQGYKVEYLEKFQRIYKRNKTIYLKRDILASDGLAYNENELILWNVTDDKHVSEHVARYEQLNVPAYIKKFVIVWELGNKAPEIIEV